ncbi:MAG: THUMP domain-containing protein [Paludibacteraceae bacterium]|nr:THUMP domain-containing protein [Paludibacteraceae bacterium]
MGEKFELIAKTFQGLEEVLAKELVKLGAEKIEVLRRGVSFWGDQEMMYKANLCLRTAVRIIKPIYTFTAENADEVYEKVKEFGWEEYLDNSKTFAIDAVVYSERFRHSQYLSYKVKDAIADRFRERTGQRPSVRLNNPDLRINVHVSNVEVTLSLDSSGEPLFKRGYRTGQTEAPMNEVLAAGILLLAGWDGQQDLIDPMCGSGTFLVEAALIAKNIMPGIYRDSFAFEKWADFDADLLQRLYEDDSQEREFTHKIYGSDILKQAIAITDDNVKSAGVTDCVVTKVSPFEELEMPSNDALIVSNPPYGIRLKEGETSTLYERFGSKLKKECQGLSAWIITPPNPDTTQSLGLAPSKRIALDNGGIACELRRYDMFAGRRDDFLREKAANADATATEEAPVEDLGYTFRKYEYPDPDAREIEEKEPRRDGDRKPFGSRRDDRGRGFGRGPREENQDETDGYTFETEEERAAYLQYKLRHRRFEEKKEREAREAKRAAKEAEGAERAPREKDENKERGERRENRGGFRKEGRRGFNSERDKKFGSNERHTGQSWRRDGYRPREERGGSRPARHDFRNDNHQPKRTFDRRKQRGEGGAD